eukprot:scaffold30274_cov67-Cyclotella_meneghiniana.AAC.5
MEVVLARLHNVCVVVGRPTDRGALHLDEVATHRFAALVKTIMGECSVIKSNLKQRHHGVFEIKYMCY